jgi:hypothetical protein
MFNKFRIGAACVVLVSGLGMAGTANAATTASATAQANILAALNIVSDGSKLDFGTIAYNGAGTVTVDTAGSAVRTCSANLVCSGTPDNAGFNVTGGASQNVGVTPPPASITISNGTNTMTVDSFTSSLVGWTGNLGVGGAFSFNVGGTLHVAGTESAGLYTGNFSVSVAYQ